MEIDELKSLWKSPSADAAIQGDLEAMLKENRHPVLKGIRVQLLAETAGMILFLVVFYSMFDGNKKPAAINLSLVIAVTFPILHQLYGYRLNQHLVQGHNLVSSIQAHIRKLKIYIVISLFSRLVFMIGLCLFFGYNIQYDQFKYYCALAISIVFIFQLLVLLGIWNKRLRHLNQTLKGLEDFN